MALPSLLVCIVLSALSVHANVVSDFSWCRDYFYRGVEPGGMDQNAVKICQKYNNVFHFATLYSIHHRIPVYSAYTFDRSNLVREGTFKRPAQWFLEPELGPLGTHSYSDEEMRPESDFEGQEITQLGQRQALNGDYDNSGYDRGHLLPNSYVPNKKRMATFTLTNAVPMDPCFNRVLWFKLETELKNLLKEELSAHPKGTAYIVTGTVPHQNDRIPKKEEDQTPSGDYERVTVPTHIWAAVCFVDNSDQNHPYSFSFGYVGENRPESTVRVKLFPDMNYDLIYLYSLQGERRSVRVFVDDCNTEEPEKNREKLKNIMKLSMKAGEVVKPDGSNLPAKRKKFNSLTSYVQESEVVKSLNKMACVLTEISVMSWMPGRKKRDVGSEAVQCGYVLEQSVPASHRCADGSPCQSEIRYCETDSGFKPCCTAPCLYEQSSRDYRCFSGGTQIQCSPQYSAITMKGEKCKDNHPCATYGEEYYWCKTASSWDYCSPPLWNSRDKNGLHCRPNHACAKYGETYTWCYTDDKNNWDPCCTHDDCFSAVNGKTCKSDHPCGKHDGTSYLWCYTTDGYSDHCCKDCSKDSIEKTATHTELLA